MASEHPDPVKWDKVAAELQAAREAQQRTWGDIDNAALGRYLADEATSSERAEIESALQALPELKLLTELVRDVLAESGAAEPSAPVTVAPAAVTTTVPAPPLPLQRPVPFVHKARWGTTRQRGAVLAMAACLFIAVGLWAFWPGTNKRHGLPEESFARSERDSTDVERTLHGDRRPGLMAKRDESDLKLAMAARAVEDLQHEVDAKLEKDDAESVLVAARKLTEAADNKALEEDGRYATKAAAGWSSAGLAYATAGDYDQATEAFRRAFEINRKKLGENHEVTRETCFRLTTVLQDGMATPPAPGNPYANPYGPDNPYAMGYGHRVGVSSVHTAMAKDVRGSDRHAFEERREAFRAKMNRPEAQAHVRTSVLPYLTNALRDASSTKERVDVANALGNLGAIASDAQPVVVECLEQAKDTREQQALVWALSQMGPPNEDAVPALAQTLRCCDAQVRQPVANYLARAPKGQALLNELAEKGKAEEKACAREALQRPRGGR
jgi:tetratricopeptide (TPR) repeat protein